MFVWTVETRAPEKEAASSLMALFTSLLPKLKHTNLYFIIYSSIYFLLLLKFILSLFRGAFFLQIILYSGECDLYSWSFLFMW